MHPTARWFLGLAVSFVVGLVLAGWWGTSSDWKRWDREQRQPLLKEIAALRPRVAEQQLVNQTLLARLDSAAKVRPPITLPPKREPVSDAYTLPPADASAPAWRSVAMDARAALAVEREARDRAERNWAIYGERARVAEARLDTATAELAASDSLLTEQAALLRQSEVVLEAAPKPRAAWVTISGEAGAILGGGRIAAAEAVIGPGNWQVVGRAETATGTGQRAAILIRRSFRL